MLRSLAASFTLALLLTHPAGASTLFSKNFDADDGGFTAASTSGTQMWSYDATAGTWNAAGDDGSGTPANAEITSPALTITAALRVRLTVVHRWSFEEGYDGGQIQVATNGGDFAAVPTSAFKQNGYNIPSLGGNGALLNQPVFGTKSAGYSTPAYVTTVAELAPLPIGTTLEFRFQANWDEYYAEPAPNWQVDSVLIELLEDSDGDGMPDSFEDANGLNKNSAADAALDPDNDGLTNLAEFMAGTNPQQADTDGDGLKDGWETKTGTWVSATNTGTDPLKADTDGDLLGDGVETRTGTFVSAVDTGTDPNVADSDGDGYTDGDELLLGTNPTLLSSKPALPLVIGYWPFDDRSATSTADLSPGLHAAAVQGGVTYVDGASGLPGDSAASFDGSGALVTGHPLLANLAQYTMAGWLKFDTAQSSRTGFFGQNDAAEFGMISAAGMQHWTPSAGSLDYAFGSTAPTWTHVAVVSDASGRTLYVNGAAVATSATVNGAAASTSSFNIGGAGIFDATGNFFRGAIDDVAVWKTPLSAEQVALLASRTVTPLGKTPTSPPFVITAVARDTASGHVTLTWNSLPGRSYAVRYSTDLKTFPLLDTGIEATSGSTSFTDDLSTLQTKERYYKIELLPLAN